jgi:hypothetical protein
VKAGGSSALLATCYNAGFLLGFFGPEDEGDVFLKKSADFDRLHDIVSQKIVLFITTAVRT